MIASNLNISYDKNNNNIISGIIKIITSVIQDKLNNNFNELRKFLKSKRFNLACLDKIIEYLMKAIDINKKYLEDKIYSLK